ncbi:hypothetical protein TNCV_4276581 [Trichonephila clavipes]|nr:hypothetical protein TNCV_4276581 [Trichonephila clavipes]
MTRTRCVIFVYPIVVHTITPGFSACIKESNANRLYAFFFCAFRHGYNHHDAVRRIVTSLKRCRGDTSISSFAVGCITVTTRLYATTSRKSAILFTVQTVCGAPNVITLSVRAQGPNNKNLHQSGISCTVGVSCRSFLTKRIFYLSDFAMSSLEQRANIKFCVLLEKSPETFGMLKKVYGKDSSTRGVLPVSMAESEIEGTSFCVFR